MPRTWIRRSLPLVGMGEQSAAAPDSYAQGEVSLLRDALFTGPGLASQAPDWLRAVTLGPQFAAIFAEPFTATDNTDINGYNGWVSQGSGWLKIFSNRLKNITVVFTNSVRRVIAGFASTANYRVYCEITSPTTLGTGQEFGFRVRQVNTDAPNPSIYVIIQPEAGFTQAKLIVYRRNAGGTIIDQAPNLSKLAWTALQTRRVVIEVIGTAVTAWVEPSGGGTPLVGELPGPIVSSTTTMTLTDQLLGGSNGTVGIHYNNAGTVDAQWDDFTIETPGSEDHAACGAFPFEQKGGLAVESQGVAFSVNFTGQVVRLSHLSELDLSVARIHDAISAWTELRPPFITGFEMFGKFYFVPFAYEAASLRKGMYVYDPTGAGTITNPTFDLNAGAQPAGPLRFRGIVKHRGATILGWGYRHEDTPDGPEFLRFCKYGAPDTWVPDLSEVSAGFIQVGTVGVPIIAAAQSGQYTIVGKVSEVFALDGDYSSQFYLRPIGSAHGPVALLGMTTIGEAAVWMSSEGPTISVQGGKVQLLGINKLTRRFLQYMDLRSASAVHDQANKRVLWAMRRRFDENGAPVQVNYLTEILVWDYQRNEFAVGSLPGQVFCLGVTRGPQNTLAGPVGVVSNLAASEIGATAALITWTPGDTAPDVSFEIQWRPNGNPDWRPVPPNTTPQQQARFRLTGLSPSTLIDVQVRQVRNGQVSAYVQALALFTTQAFGTVTDPQNVTVEISYYIKAQGGTIVSATARARVGWTPQVGTVNVAIHVYRARSNSFPAAVRVTPAQGLDPA
ncbi:MAG: fibronectin type III domain-containing protein, partial [Gemmatimonadota bacterium]|nr:fibronectin type III domain-containing protein [Gemmatimonadota bacterium]